MIRNSFYEKEEYSLLTLICYRKRHEMEKIFIYTHIFLLNVFKSRIQPGRFFGGRRKGTGPHFFLCGQIPLPG
jgi:hypothetical protein